MPLIPTLSSVRALPPPSPEQREAFVGYLCGTHSWYKHIPLPQPAHFVLFLAEDAGSGYPPERPRLHHGWKTTDEYRQRFGWLDYAWRFSAEGPWSRDAGEAIEAFEPELQTLGGFLLGPLCSDDLDALPLICDLWSSEALTGPRGEVAVWWWDQEPSLQAQVPAELRARIDALDEALEALSEAREALSSEERELAFELQAGFASLPDPASPALLRWHQALLALRALHQPLQEAERSSIRAALARLLGPG